MVGRERKPELRKSQSKGTNPVTKPPGSGGSSSIMGMSRKGRRRGYSQGSSKAHAKPKPMEVEMCTPDKWKAPMWDEKVFGEYSYSDWMNKFSDEKKREIVGRLGKK